jgi:hypothetical protein
MNRKFTLCWSTISIKSTWITSHITSLNKKKTTDVRNLGPVLGQAHIRYKDPAPTPPLDNWKYRFLLEEKCHNAIYQDKMWHLVLLNYQIKYMKYGNCLMLTNKLSKIILSRKNTVVCRFLLSWPCQHTVKSYLF